MFKVLIFFLRYSNCIIIVHKELKCIPADNFVLKLNPVSIGFNYYSKFKGASENKTSIHISNQRKLLVHVYHIKNISKLSVS